MTDKPIFYQAHHSSDLNIGKGELNISASLSETVNANVGQFILHTCLTLSRIGSRLYINTHILLIYCGRSKKPHHNNRSSRKYIITPLLLFNYT